MTQGERGEGERREKGVRERKGAESELAGEAKQSLSWHAMPTWLLLGNCWAEHRRNANKGNL